MFIYILKISIINLPFPLLPLPQYGAAVYFFFIQDYLHFRLTKYLEDMTKSMEGWETSELRYLMIKALDNCSNILVR